jgi:RNA polymerase sigma-70 factor, ECF subfamily
MTKTELKRFQALQTARVAELEHLTRDCDGITVDRSSDDCNLDRDFKPLRDARATLPNDAIAHKRFLQEGAVMQRFLEMPTEDSFADLFKTLTPQLIAFFRARGCELAEDLAQEVMLIVYRKAPQIRDRTLFRAWMFKIARNALYRQYGKKTREVDTVDLADVADRFVAGGNTPAATPAFEFLHWMTFLNSHEREVMTLRFIEQWEYNEIAAAQVIPLGTVKWTVFNAKKKLAPHLKTRQSDTRNAA